MMISTIRLTVFPAELHCELFHKAKIRELHISSKDIPKEKRIKFDVGGLSMMTARSRSRLSKVRTVVIPIILIIHLGEGPALCNTWLSLFFKHSTTRRKEPLQLRHKKVRKTPICYVYSIKGLLFIWLPVEWKSIQTWSYNTGSDKGVSTGSSN